MFLMPFSIQLLCGGIVKLMSTKQINDLISFVAMNAMNGVDSNQAAKWITEQNLDKEIADHLQIIIDMIANKQHTK